VNTAWNITNRIGRGRGLHRGGDDAVGLTLRRAQLGRGRRLPLRGRARRLARGGKLVEAAHQVVGAAAPHRRRGDRRHAELGREPVEVDVDAAPPRDVDHVEHEQQGAADALQFEHQPQRQPEVGGVGDA